MPAGIDQQLVVNYYRQMDDELLLHALRYDSKGLTAAALEIVKAEVHRRKLDTAIIGHVEALQQPDTYVPKAYDPEGSPVDEPIRIELENCFMFLVNLFGKEATYNRPVLTPDVHHFPIRYDGSEQAAKDALTIVARQMEVVPREIALDFYDDNIRYITEGSPGGIYWGKGLHGKYEISIVRTLLDDPEQLIATLAHEIAHIKLLDEHMLEENNERLTDLATIFFGLGIFNANAAFQTFRDARSHGWSTSGYLNQMEWGYALALWATYRNETATDWFNYLCVNVQADFKQAMRFIENNRDLVAIEMHDHPQ